MSGSCIPLLPPQYMALSFAYISLGLMLGLLPGVSFLFFTRFPDYSSTCITLTCVAWVLWLFQFLRGYSAISTIYQNFPGWDGVTSFSRGYFSIFPTLKPVGPESHKITRNRVTQNVWACNCSREGASTAGDVGRCAV